MNHSSGKNVDVYNPADESLTSGKLISVYLDTSVGPTALITVVRALKGGKVIIAPIDRLIF